MLFLINKLEVGEITVSICRHPIVKISVNFLIKQAPNGNLANNDTTCGILGKLDEPIKTVDFITKLSISRKK